MTNLVESKRTGRGAHVLVGLLLLGGLVFQGLQSLSTQANVPVPSVATHVDPKAAYAASITDRPRYFESLEERAARDPVKFLEDAIEQYDRSVRDYTCVFTKQEMLGNQLSPEQVIRAMFREKPFSVRMEWLKNADKCQRVLYVADRWTENNQPMALIEPGAIAKLFVSYVMRPIHGKDAMKSSRRTIDQFGLRNAMALSLKYCKLSREQGKLDYRFIGTGKVDERETLVFERRLPYTGEGGTWPDRILVIHLDKELLVPTLCLCYADEERKVLLGKYMTTDIRLNANLPDSVFSKEGMGL